MRTDAPPTRFGPWKREVMAFVELFALAGIAVAQPTFDLLGKNANELVVNGRTRSQIIVMVILVLLIPPVLAWTAEVAIGIVAPRLRPYAHAAIAAVILATFAVELLKRATQWNPTALLAAGATIGLAGGYLLLRYRPPRLFLHYLAFAPLVFAVMFVFFSPATTLLFPDEAEAADVEIGNPARVVMIVMDELPLESLLDGNGHIDAELFPNFARLANTSNWYRNHTTISPHTTSAVPALLTGDLPSDARALPVASEYPDNLFTLLGGEYRINAHEIVNLCPASLCPPRAQPGSGRSTLRGLLVDTAQIWKTFASPEREDTSAAGSKFDFRLTGGATGAFLRSLTADTRPRFDFLHVVLPHQGWRFLPSGQDNGAFSESSQVLREGKAVWPTQWAASVGRQRHLQQVQYTDSYLGAIIDKLERIGAWDESLVVVTADHGVSFSALESVRGVSARNYSQILWTPLFIKAPGQTGGAVSDDPVRSTDVLPTVADLLDVDLPWAVDGRSVLEHSRTERDVVAFNYHQNTVLPPPGRQFVSLDGARGFDEVLKAQASPAGGDPTLRLYRLGPFGDLIGAPAAPLVRGSDAELTGRVDSREKFDAVDPTARKVPWAWISGTVAGAGPGDLFAVTVNGIISGMSELIQEDGRATFWSSLPLQFFRPGPNDIGVYRIRNSSGTVRLEPVLLSR